MQLLQQAAEESINAINAVVDGMAEEGAKRESKQI